MKNNFNYSNIKRKAWLQKQIDENGPVITLKDRENNSEKYQDYLSMPQKEFVDKYSKNLS